MTLRLCQADQTNLERAREKILGAYGKDRNVNGVGIGYRRTGGKWTDKPAVVVLVTKKRPEAYVSRRRLLPRTIDVDGTTYEVDVLEAGPFTAGDATALAPVKPAPKAATADIGVTEKIRPPRQGASISNPDDGRAAGTLGLFTIDNTDDTVCVLSCNHVMAREGRASAGDPIVQPGVYDGGTASDAIATLKRWTTLQNGTRVDGAIAQLTDQSAYTLDVAQNLMAPISADHPAVGVYFAGDTAGFTGLMTRIDATLDALNVRVPLQGAKAGSVTDLPCAQPGVGLADPYPGMLIEKVGRTTGYTSSEILAIGVTGTVGYPTGEIELTDLLLTSFFGAAGDSGSVVFAGGDGGTLSACLIALSCEVLTTVGGYYSIPLAADNPLVDKARDEFMMQSVTGTFLSQLVYVNTGQIIDRLKAREPTADEVAYAQQFYDKYRNYAADLINDPDSPDTVTQEQLDDAKLALDFLSQTVLTAEESDTATSLYDDLVPATLGKNRAELLEYMNQADVHSRVDQAVSALPEVERPSTTESGCVIDISIPCPVLMSVGAYYDIPLADDDELVDNARDVFLLQTETGKLLTQLIYVNDQTIVDRMTQQAPSSIEQEYAQGYYEFYRDRLAAILADPNSTDTLSEDDTGDYVNIVSGMLQFGILTGEEGDVAFQIYTDILEPAVGSNRSEALAYMSNPDIYSQLYEMVSGLTTVEMNKPFKQGPPEPVN